MSTFRITPLDEVQSYLISPGDTVKLAPLLGPGNGVDYSVFLEIWEPGGEQPPNSHSDEVETFLFLRGEGKATVDDASAVVQAGQYLVLDSGTVHHIANTGTGRMYAITTMAPDGGFHALVTRGVPTALDDEDREVLGSMFGI